MSLLRRAHDHHRDLRTRLPAAVVAHPIDRARQFMTITPLSPSPTPLPPTSLSHRQRPRFADSDRQRRLRPAKPGALEYQITAPIASRAAKTGARARSLNRRPCPEPTNQIKQRRQIPHRPTPASAPTPPRFPPSRLFGRLPPCTPSRLCLAGIRKPLTIPAVLSIALEPLCLTESSPSRATSSRPNNARVSAQVMLPRGSQTADVTLPKSVDCRSGRSQPAFINKREGTRGQTARLEQEGRRTWEI